MRVEVYKNLHKSTDDTVMWSVRALEGPQKGRVITHEMHLLLTDAKMVVQPAGNRKVRREGRKVVHAFIRGDWAGYEGENDVFERMTHEAITGSPAGEITYNPYKNESFVWRNTGEPIYTAKFVGLFASGRVRVTGGNK